MTFFVCEVQNNTMTTFAFSTKEDADEKFFDILRYACKSSVEHHGAVIIDNNGLVRDCRFYDHTQTEETAE